MASEAWFLVRLVCRVATVQKKSTEAKDGRRKSTEKAKQHNGSRPKLKLGSGLADERDGQKTSTTELGVGVDPEATEEVKGRPTEQQEIRRLQAETQLA